MAERKQNSAATPILAVGVAAWNDSGEVVLVRRANPPRQGEWSIPGGKLGWGENLRTAAMREMLEETGLTLSLGPMIDVVELLMRDESGKVTHHYLLVDFAARVTGGVLKAASDALDARFVAPMQLDDYPMWEETRRIIGLSEIGLSKA
jgi:8-oxo-dGTP diphosphatase